MHIKFKHIDIQNFMSIGRGSIDLENQGYVLINGINKRVDDNAKSNGSGKSSCIESIVWALTGETIRGTKDVVNMNNPGGCRVTLVFEIDGISYKLIRTKDDMELGTNLKLYVDSKDVSGKGIRDTQKKLEQYLPELNISLIGSVIILGQGLPQRFTNNTPAGRKEVLEKLSKSDFMIEDIKEKLSTRKAELSGKLRESEDTLLGLTTTQKLVQQQIEDLKKDKESIIPMDYDTLLSQKKLEMDELDREMQTLSKQVDEIGVLVKQKQEEHNQLVYEKLKQEYSNKESELYSSYLESVDNSITEISNKIALKKQEISRLEAVVDTCPTCGQKLPDVHKIDTTTLKQELVVMESTLAEKQAMRVDYGKMVKDELDKLAKEQGELKEKSLNELANVTDTQNKLVSLLKEKQETFNTLKVDFGKLLVAKENYDQKYANIDNEIEKNSLKLYDISNKLAYNISDRDNISAHLDVVTKMVSAASREFRGFLLSEIVKYINTRAKSYSQDVFQTDKIEFMLDGNNISISYCGKDYENLSGGEKQRVDLIVQFALRDMLTQHMGFSANIIALDEIFDNLDTVGCQNVINMISGRLQDVESVYIITHHGDSLDIPYDKQLFVVKNEMGVSEIL